MRFLLDFTTGQFYGCANGSIELAEILLAFWAGKNVVYAVGFGSEATATSCGIRDLCVWQKVSGSECWTRTWSRLKVEIYPRKGVFFYLKNK